MSNALRQHYIEVGAIVPDQPTTWTSTKTTLPLDDEGTFAAEEHIIEDGRAAYEGRLSELPLEQVPEYVLNYWGL